MQNAPGAFQEISRWRVSNKIDWGGRGSFSLSPPRQISHWTVGRYPSKATNYAIHSLDPFWAYEDFYNVLATVKMFKVEKYTVSKFATFWACAVSDHSLQLQSLSNLTNHGSYDSDVVGFVVLPNATNNPALYTWSSCPIFVREWSCALSIMTHLDHMFLGKLSVWSVQV